jgi:hypothetical protein
VSTVLLNNKVNLNHLLNARIEANARRPLSLFSALEIECTGGVLSSRENRSGLG